MATRNQIASLLDHMADQIFVAADPYEQEWTLAEFRWLCEQSGLDAAFERIKRGIRADRDEETALARHVEESLAFGVKTGGAHPGAFSEENIPDGPPEP
jgi:hypothetical protein